MNLFMPFESAVLIEKEKFIKAIFETKRFETKRLETKRLETKKTKK